MDPAQSDVTEDPADRDGDGGVSGSVGGETARPARAVEAASTSTHGAVHPRRKRHRAGGCLRCREAYAVIGALTGGVLTNATLLHCCVAVVSVRLGSVSGIWVSGTIAIVGGDGRLLDHCGTGILRTRIPGRLRAASTSTSTSRGSPRGPVSCLCEPSPSDCVVISAALDGAAAPQPRRTPRTEGQAPARARTSHVSASCLRFVRRHERPIVDLVPPACLRQGQDPPRSGCGHLVH